MRGKGKTNLQGKNFWQQLKRRNLLFKFLALALAIALWIYVVRPFSV